MRIAITVGSCLLLVIVAGSTALCAPPSLRECLIHTEDTGTWTATREKLGSWVFSFSGDGTFTAISNGKMSYQNRFWREKSIDWEQTVTGAWELNQGGTAGNPSFTLKLTAKNVETKFSTPLPSPANMLDGKEIYSGKLPEKKELLTGTSIFSLLPQSKLNLLMWTHGNSVFASTVSRDMRLIGIPADISRVLVLIHE